MMSDHMDTGWERSIKSIPIFIFIRSKNANTVMKFIRLQGKRQISNYVSGQKHCWQKDRGFRLFLRGKVSLDTGFDTAKLEEFDRVVDVTEQLSPDYDYEKLKENYKDTLLGNYIEEMERRPQDVVTKKALEYGVNALLGYKICR